MAKTLKHYGFWRCLALESLSMPNLETMVGHALSGTTETSSAVFSATLIQHINFPKLTSVCQEAFSGMASLKTATLQKLAVAPSQCFEWCTSLEWVDLGSVTSLGSHCFRSCEALKTIILRNADVVCTLPSNVNFFCFATPFASGGTGGVVLVPSALVESYKADTNWSVLLGYGACELLALEDYTTDGTTTGDIDWDKLNSRATA